MEYLSVFNKNIAKHVVINNKKVKIATFFNSKTFSTEVAEYQKKVFDKFNLIINQYDNDIRHPEFMDNFMKNEDSDVYIFFDIDCIPLVSNIYELILNEVSDNSIFGVAQQDNCFPNNVEYAGPSCFAINKIMYEKLGKISFVEGQRDFLGVGRSHGDVAEEFSRVCRDNDYKVNLWYPTHYDKDDQVWKLGDKYFGNGTIYNDSVYHCFEIRLKKNENRFIKKCKEILQ